MKEAIYRGPGEVAFGRDPDDRVRITISAENNSMSLAIPLSSLLGYLRELGFIK